MTDQFTLFPEACPSHPPACDAVDAVDALITRLEPWYPDLAASLRSLTCASDARRRLIEIVRRQAPAATTAMILAALRDRDCVA